MESVCDGLRLSVSSPKNLTSYLPYNISAFKTIPVKLATHKAIHKTQDRVWHRWSKHFLQTCAASVIAFSAVCPG